MYFRFIWELLKRAFTPTPRITDMLQILAASALPATVKFLGVSLPKNAEEDALAYIGLIVLFFVIIRLFWAPYAIWKDDISQIEYLKAELSKPEQIEIRMMAKMRAKNRMKFIKEIKNLSCAAILKDAELFNNSMKKALKYSSYNFASPIFDDAFAKFIMACDLCIKDGADNNIKIARHIEVRFIDYLHNKICLEELGKNINSIVIENRGVFNA